MLGKSIRIFLPEGNPTGMLIAEIINWTGKVLVAPRVKLPEFVVRQELRRPGVYMLVGPDPEHPGRDLVYIGEAILQGLARGPAGGGGGTGRGGVADWGGGARWPWGFWGVRRPAMKTGCVLAEPQRVHQWQRLSSPTPATPDHFFSRAMRDLPDL